MSDRENSIEEQPNALSGDVAPLFNIVLNNISALSSTGFRFVYLPLAELNLYRRMEAFCGLICSVPNAAACR
jgi:hypothetical protein